MRIGATIILILFCCSVFAADEPVYHDNQFIERVRTDDRGRQVLSFVDYDGLPITGTVQSFKDNEHKTFHVVDGLAQGMAVVENVQEKVTQIKGFSSEDALRNDETQLIIIEQNKEIWHIPYENGIIDGAVFVYDKDGHLINEQIYGAGVKTIESFYRPNGQMYKYVRYFPNDRVVPLVQEEKLYDENGKIYAQIDSTFHDNGLMQQRVETTYDDKGNILSTFSTSYDLSGYLIDGAFEAEKNIPVYLPYGT